MTNLAHLGILLKKEIMQLVKDRKMCITIFGAPVWMVILFGYAATMDLKDCTFAVLDRARTQESRALTAALENSDVFVRQADFLDEADMCRRTAEKKVRLGVVFPPDFTHTRKVELIADGRNTSSAGMATGYASTILTSRKKNTDVRKRLDKDMFKPKLVTRAWFNPDYDARWFTVPCLLSTLLINVLTMLVALSLAREREAGTMDQLHLTPYSPFEQLFAKGMSGVAVGVLQALTALILILFWFNCPLTGSVAALVVLLLAFLTSSVGLGLLISVNCANMQQAMITTTVLTLPLTMLSGMMTPVESMPDIFQKFALVNPVRWAIEALQQIFLEGAGFEAVWMPVLILVTLGVGSFTAAWLKFRKM